MSKPHVCFLNRCYWPDAEATGQLLTQLCEFLTPRWDVTAVVGQPNFAIDAIDAAHRGAERRNGVQIERLDHLRWPKHRPAARLANLLSFTNQVRRWGRRIASVPDVIVCETDPFLMPPIARRIAHRSNAKLVFYLQDIYPDVAVALGIVRDRMIAKAIRSRLRAAYQDADAIVVLDEDMRDRLIDWGVDAEKLRIVPNWVDCEVVRPLKTANPFRMAEAIDDRFVVMHSGNMGLTQRLDVLVAAMQDARIPEKALLALVGGGAKRAALEAAGQRALNIRFWDYQPIESLAESLSAADLHVISMDARITGCIAPSKLYGVLGSGTPVLAIVPRESSVWRFVEKHQLGWTAEPGDVATIAKAIQEAADQSEQAMRMKGSRARALAEKDFDRATCCGQFEEVLRELLG